MMPMMTAVATTTTMMVMLIMMVKSVWRLEISRDFEGRVKAATLKSMWDMLPAAVQDAHNAAGKFNDGSARNHHATIVNNAWGVAGDKYVMQDDHLPP